MNSSHKYSIGDTIFYIRSSFEVKNSEGKTIQGAVDTKREGNILAMFQNPTSKKWYYEVDSEDYWIEDSEIV